ncbi:MAG: LysM peptidoglycan-binding domain-containing protein [Mariprofundaceae bacterium]
MLRSLFSIFMIAFLMTLPIQVKADVLALPQGVAVEDVKVNLPQPYTVKKGDTLWDIASYFFKDPYKWIKVWERNLYITNPDLIYPGNEIWFDVKKQKQGGLSKVRPLPKVSFKAVERLEAQLDTSMLLTALARQDFVNPGAVDGVGYLLDSEDDRINYGANDHVYVKMSKPANEGEIFDIFRTGDPINDPDTGKTIGVLVNHLGQLEISSKAGDIYRGVILEAFEEISRGDRLKLAKNIDTRITRDFPTGDLRGKVLYIRNNAAEAGQNQVIGISLGLSDGMQAGTALSIHRAGRMIHDRVSKKDVILPEETIGQLLVLVAQKGASLALVTRSTGPINIGDVVRNKARR